MINFVGLSWLQGDIERPRKLIIRSLHMQGPGRADSRPS